MREQNKEKRRLQIIAAAEKLIFRDRSTEFSMNELADEAGISMKTTYNLIGSKSKVLYALLSTALDKIDAQAMGPSSVSDIGSLVYMAENPIGLFTGMPDFYRPLLRYLLGTPNSTERPIFMARAYRFWLSGVTQFEEAHKGKFNASAMALHLHTYFAGALDLWVQDEIDAEEFRRHLRCAAAMALLPLVDKKQVPMLLSHIDLFRATAASYEASMAAIADSTEQLISS